MVAYYSELLHGNMDDLAQTHFLYPFLNINNQLRAGGESCQRLTLPGVEVGQLPGVCQPQALLALVA